MIAIWIGLGGGVIGGVLANLRPQLTMPFYTLISICVAVAASLTEPGFREALFFGAAGIAICAALLLMIALLSFKTTSHLPPSRTPKR